MLVRTLRDSQSYNTEASKFSQISCGSYISNLFFSLPKDLNYTLPEPHKLGKALSYRYL